MVHNCHLWGYQLQTSLQVAGNFHGPYEYASIDVMEKAVQVIIGIVEDIAENH